MTSIYDFICDNMDSKGFLPKGEPLKLPDHNTLDVELQENWVPGEFEAVMVRLPYRMKEMSIVNYLIARTVCKCIKAPTQKNRQKMYDKLRKYATVSIADPVLSHLAGMKIDRVKASKLARELVTKSEDRALVKFGIVLLGAYGNREDCDIVSRVGIHEEFTFFAVKAIRNLDKTPDYQRRLIELAERTSGWGKIATVFEFSDRALEDETREWILRYGCKNTIGLHFTACECAIKGLAVDYLAGRVGNDEIFAASNIDSEMTEGLCDIIEGLLQGSTMKAADGVNEVPGIKGLSSSIKWLSENNRFDGNDSRMANLSKQLADALK